MSLLRIFMPFESCQAVQHCAGCGCALDSLQAHPFDEQGRIRWRCATCCAMCAGESA